MLIENNYKRSGVFSAKFQLLLFLSISVEATSERRRLYPTFGQPDLTTPRLSVLHDDVKNKVTSDEESANGYGAPRSTGRRNRYQASEVSRDKPSHSYGTAQSIDSPSHSYASSQLNRDPADGVALPTDIDKQVVTGIPDLSDPCFRRYANSIIVNAQPYERRSSISLVQCKNQCLQSQIGVYSCRSFVYDNVCDLFAHVGDQSPARLLRFQTRDYFEPTSAVTCKPTFNDAIPATPPSFIQPPLPPIPTTFEPILPPAVETTTRKQIAVEPSSFQETGSITPFFIPVSSVSELTPENDVLSTIAPEFSATTALSINQFQSSDQKNTASCESGQIPRFLKTSDFELHNHDDMRLEGVTLNECIDFCSTNFAVKDNGSSIKCNSFEFNNDGICILSKETAVPLGNGQLKQRHETDYYEKVCVDERLAGECPSSVYNRFPQMILVGFAETVVDAPSLQHCFDNCLNSRQLYGFRCASGMYYFEEPQLNCILNTEDRTTQPDLFTSENSDLVDYFETSCNQSSAANRRFASPISSRNSITSKKKDFVERLPNGHSMEKLLGSWTEWSSCKNGTEQLQYRQKLCAKQTVCGRDVRPCVNTNVQEPNMGQVIDALRKRKCPADVCCPIFGECNIGIIQNLAVKQLQWCKTTCNRH
ncbi:hypothetical protein M3Y96_00847600 [Aphelenchoides besseyi]|nr:hypothetical protein M3Y96_00847600 [Aphelenchoides besseyi]